MRRDADQIQLESRQAKATGSVAIRSGVLSCLLVSGALIAACGGGAQSPPSRTSGLVKVEVNSRQAIPNGNHNVTLSTSASLSKFENEVTSDDITLISTSTTRGCAGGTEYKLVLVRTGAADITLNAYSCGGSVSGNMGGNVQAFLNYVSSLFS